MNTPPFGRSPWSTSAFGQAADTSALELLVLGEHLSLCRSLSGRRFALRCSLILLHDIIARRCITTVVVVVAVAAMIATMTGLFATGSLA
jgi:hypothetical protein